MTIDDLVKSANIAKGSFYAFYENKEQLFMELNMEEQEKFFSQIDAKIETSGIKEPKVLTCYIFNEILERFINNPILIQIDMDMLTYLQRKIPTEIMEQHIANDSIAFKKLKSYNVKFAFPLSTIVKVLHHIFSYAVVNKYDSDYSNIIKILINGVVSQILK